MEKSSQYDSFLFWRQPIRTIDLLELEVLGLELGEPIIGSKAKDKTYRQHGKDNEEESFEFSYFNYWRAPIADVDALLADLNLLP